jgi:lipopolysaccharide transport system ATP-binding protein
MRAERERKEDGRTAEAADIRQPVGLEMEYEVLRPGHVLLPYYNVFNQEGVKVFSAVDQDPAWQGRPRPVGRYISTAWIPGNLLAEGMLFVGPAVRDPQPKVFHGCYAPEAVAFQVVDSMDGDSARGDFTGRMSGTVRPLLRWETRLSPDESKATTSIAIEEE